MTSKAASKSLEKLLVLNDEVVEAKRNDSPIVALESTIITHGMPYPENVETARAVEQQVRDNGAVPATIAVLNSTIRIGLSDSELDHLGKADSARKLSRADFAHGLMRGDIGSTTVAATMMVAELAGIRVFATGGLGGVHRDYNVTLDLSADLMEFRHSNVAVVCAGVKAILDIAKTLEYLESLGVPVVTLGAKEFPAFWSRSSGIPSPLQLDSTNEIADLIRLRDILGQKEGIVIGNPLPPEFEISAEAINPVIQEALKAAATASISGKSITPFLLQKIVELTGGQSLKVNQTLIERNAAVAAQIAVALAN